MQKLTLGLAALALSGVAFAHPGPNPISNETAMADESKSNVDTPVATEATEPEEKFVVPAGFRAKTIGDKVLYCRSERVTGSRFRTETCYSEEKLKALALEREQANSELNQKRLVCANPETCASQ